MAVPALLLVAIVSGGPTANAETQPLTDATLSQIAAGSPSEKAVEDAAVMAATSYRYGVNTPAVVQEATPTPTPVQDNVVSTNTIEPTVNEVLGIQPGTTHTVVGGDTLGSIALNYYGKSSKWRDIRDANPDTLNGGIKLSLGMELNIPVLTE